jgi:Tfp pilus assembly pilus retraction ATPase PilT
VKVYQNKEIVVQKKSVLRQEIENFLQNNNQKILLVEGKSTSGKSFTLTTLS